MQYSEFLTIFDGMAGPIWVPTIHGIVARPGALDIEDLEASFQRQFKKYRQVHVEPFYRDFLPSQNIDRIVRYANKHNDTIKIDGVKWDWDDDWLEAYYGWLHQWSRGSLSLKFHIGRREPFIKSDILIEHGCSKMSLGSI